MKKLILAAVMVVALVACRKSDRNAPVIDKSLNLKAVGASANDFLSAQNYSSVLVEINYMPGYAPVPDAVDLVRGFINNLVNKPVGIQVIQREIPASGKGAISLQEVATIESRNRTVYTSGHQLGVYILITDANYDQPSILGFAFRNTSIALFGKIIHDNSDRPGKPARVKMEAAVLSHEFGHLFGLVNSGSSMQVAHEDVPHAGHCNNAECLMYYGVNTTTVGGVLMNEPIPPLDQNCKSDLRANGGK